jgi:nicotinate-nucleotide pyrophosphorylase (carboxylating)
MGTFGRDLDLELLSFLHEDIGRGDVTTASVLEPGERASGYLLAKSETVACGVDVALRVFQLLDPEALIEGISCDGDRVSVGTRLGEVSGLAAALLAGERTALNLLQRMCAIASETQRYVRAVDGTACRILDTRKTAPGLRVFDKRAVAAGGGKNHRFGLDDGILIKDNHRRLAGGAGPAVERARRRASAGLRIEAEVETEAQLREAIEAGADILLLDNRTPEEVRRMVSVARALSPALLLEASGGITLQNVRDYAAAGVDFVSVGALTHSVEAADISFELEES